MNAAHSDTKPSNKPISWSMPHMAVWNTTWTKLRIVDVLGRLILIQIRPNHEILKLVVTSSNSKGMKEPFLSSVMEFSNIRPGLGYQYYSNEYHSLLALITYGASDKHCHMDPYGRHSRHNDNTTKFRVISECICFWRRDRLWIWLCVTQSSQSVMAGSKSKEDWLKLIKATEQWQAWVMGWGGGGGSSAIQ